MDITGGPMQTLVHDPNGVAAHDVGGSGAEELLGPVGGPAQDVGGNGAPTVLVPVGVPAHDAGGNGATSLPVPAGIVAHWDAIFVEAGMLIGTFAQDPIGDTPRDEGNGARTAVAIVS